ncbi:MAG TPA: endonuclease V [Longimicrobium sp.]|jgi:deoxyribonuclease V
MFLPLHPWNLTVAQAREVQLSLRERLVPTPPPGFAPRLVAGADVSAEKFSRRGYAGVVTVDLATLETVEEASAVVDLGFPYVPGYLSFRELPALAAAWERLERRPDVVVFDAHGYAHPRRFGLACHGGVLLDLPSIGCAKTMFVGEHGPLAPGRGATAEIVDRGEVVGVALRTRDRCNPVYVSRGHRMDLDTAVGIVLSLSRFRIPETTRRSHNLVNDLRRADKPQAP